MVDPGPIAKIYVGPDAVESSSVLRQYYELKRIHATLLKCDEACKKLILASYVNIYTEAIENYLLGYENVTPLDLLV
jgi:hypothetical protein